MELSPRSLCKSQIAVALRYYPHDKRHLFRTGQGNGFVESRVYGGNARRVLLRNMESGHQAGDGRIYGLTQYGI